MCPSVQPNKTKTDLNPQASLSVHFKKVFFGRLDGLDS